MINNQEIEPVPPAAGPQAEHSIPLGTRLKTIAGSAIAAAGVSLALIAGAQAQEAPAAKVTPAPKAAAKTPGTNPKIGQGTLVEEAPEVIEPLQVGITTYSSKHDTPDDPEGFYDHMEELGMTGARLSISRGAEGELDSLQEEIALARENGVEVVVNLGQIKDMSLEGYPAWAAETAAQLPSIERFVILNEVNSPLFSEDTLPDNIDALYKSTKLIKAVRPDAIVSGLGLASEREYDPIGYLAQASGYAYKKYGGLQNVMDTLSLHTYRRPAASYKLIQDAKDFWDGPINIDEAGWGVKNNGQIHDPKSLVSKAQQAKFYYRFLRALAADPQVENIFNYRLQNSSDPSDLKTGLITDDGEILPAYFALKSFLSSGKLEELAQNE